VNRQRQKRVVALLMAVFLVVPLIGGLLAVTGTSDDTALQQSADTTTGTLPRVSDLPTVTLSELPTEAQQTLLLITQDGPFPYDRDGAVFQNREGILPDQPEGFYHEYTVPTPGSEDRGARRIVVGGSSQFFYTDDHYESFREGVVG
jgi:ribonuclease T1